MNVEGEIPEAVVSAERGTQAWRRVVRVQIAAAPDHGDFYSLGGELVATLRALEALAGVLDRQVAGYGQGRVLRDDEGRDPSRRLALAAAHLGDAGEALGRGARSANRFWSAIGHIAVEES